MKLAPSFILFLTIIIEGYVVLSSELLAIRQITPFVGTGTDTVCIIIAAVLMPLAVGYYAGGAYRSRYPSLDPRHSIRKKLISNIFISSLFLLAGLSTLTVNIFFITLIEGGITHRLLLTTLYSLLFLVTPVYLLGQTVPLISNYFSKEALSRITGKMLFFSTVGSFFGAVFSTLILMSFIGVSNTVTFSFVLLTIITYLICKKRKDLSSLIAIVAVTATAALLNSYVIKDSMHIVSENQYNTVMVIDDKDGTRHFYQNNSDSSAINPQGERHAYIEKAESLFIDPIQDPALPPKNILVIGAGGFTFGLHDTKNNYTFVDIDPALLKVSEEHFLKAKLSPNKKFVPLAAQSYITSTDQAYDLIYLDAYNGDITLPEDLVTVEFYQSVKKLLKPRGIVAWNLILSPNFEDRLSRHLDNTIRYVFPHVSRQAVEDFDGWESDPNFRVNMIYYYRAPAGEASVNTIYTRDKNAIFFDKPQKRK